MVVKARAVLDEGRRQEGGRRSWRRGFSEEGEIIRAEDQKASLDSGSDVWQ